MIQNYHRRYLCPMMAFSNERHKYGFLNLVSLFYRYYIQHIAIKEGRP